MIIGKKKRISAKLIINSISEKKKFGRGTAYSCKTNVLIEFHYFMKKE